LLAGQAKADKRDAGANFIVEQMLNGVESGLNQDDYRPPQIDFGDYNRRIEEQAQRRIYEQEMLRLQREHNDQLNHRRQMQCTTIGGITNCYEY
jgi:hypothetical protein